MYTSLQARTLHNPPLFLPHFLFLFLLFAKAPRETGAFVHVVPLCAYAHAEGLACMVSLAPCRERRRGDMGLQPVRSIRERNLSLSLSLFLSLSISLSLPPSMCCSELREHRRNVGQRVDGSMHLKSSQRLSRIFRVF